MLVISALMFGAIWLGLTRTRIGLVIQAALTHPDMASRWAITCAHLYPRVRRRHRACRPRRRDRRQLPVTEPAMAFTMGPIVFVVVVFGGLGSLPAASSLRY